MQRSELAREHGNPALYRWQRVMFNSNVQVKTVSQVSGWITQALTAKSRHGVADGRRKAGRGILRGVVCGEDRYTSPVENNESTGHWRTLWRNSTPCLVWSTAMPDLLSDVSAPV